MPAAGAIDRVYKGVGRRRICREHVAVQAARRGKGVTRMTACHIMSRRSFGEVQRSGRYGFTYRRLRCSVLLWCARIYV